jgi:hypothetical protein
MRREIVMSGSAQYGPAWQQHIRNKEKRRALAGRFKDPKDPFKIVIVRDMWLTSFETPVATPDPAYLIRARKPPRFRRLYLDCFIQSRWQFAAGKSKISVPVSSRIRRDSSRAKLSCCVNASIRLMMKFSAS